jgi:hypothetical protein
VLAHGIPVHIRQEARKRSRARLGSEPREDDDGGEDDEP